MFKDFIFGVGGRQESVFVYCAANVGVREGRRGRRGGGLGL